PLCVVRVRPITTPARPLFPYTTLFRSSEPLSENHQQLGCVRRCAGMPPIRPFDVMDDINEPPGMGSRRVVAGAYRRRGPHRPPEDRKSTRLNSSHVQMSYAVFCLKKKN